MYRILNRTIIPALSLFLTVSLSAQEISAPGKATRVKPLPPPTEVQLPKGTSLSSDFRLMGVSHPFREEKWIPRTPYKVENVNWTGAKGFTAVQGIDLVHFETGLIREFMSGSEQFAGSGFGPSHRGIIVLRYGVENEAVLELFKNAKELGVHSAVLVTDGPISLDSKTVKFGTRVYRGQEKPLSFSNQFGPENLEKSGQGGLLRKILEAGYRFYSPQYPKEGDLIQAGDHFIAMSAAAHSSLDRKPIMHEKEVLMYILKDPKGSVSIANIEKMWVLHGTGNWTRTHYNRNYLIEEPQFRADGTSAFALKHAQAVLENFVRAGRSAELEDIQTPGRHRVTSDDGQFMEVAYTDGQMELNQRIVTFLEEVAARPDDFEIKEVVLSHFVMTNKYVVDALYKVWQEMKKRKRTFKVRGVVDAKFVGLRSFGVSTLMVGYDVKTSFGQIRQGYSQAFAKDVDLTVQFEEIPGVKNIDPDGAPRDRVLWHDKTTMIYWRALAGTRRGPLMVDIFTGSYNNSNNKDNLERQDYLRVRANSGLAMSMKDSVLSVGLSQLRAEKKALPLKEGVFTKEISLFSGQSPIDMDWKRVQLMQKEIEYLPFEDSARRAQGLTSIQETLLATCGQPSRLIKWWQVECDDLKDRAAILTRFAGWYSSLPEFRQGVDRRLTANEVLAVALSMTEKPFSAKLALRGVLWRPSIPWTVLESRIYRLFEFMQLQSYFEKRGLTPEQSAFPFRENMVFPPHLLNREEVVQVTNRFLAEQGASAAQIVLGFIQSKNLSEVQSSRLVDEVELQRRLNSFRLMTSWYEGLTPAIGATAPGSRDLALSLFSENIELWAEKNLDADLLKATLQYLLELKGFGPEEIQLRLNEALRFFQQTPSESQEVA